MPSLDATLDALALPDLFAFVGAVSATGALAIGGDQPCTVWFTDGTVTFASHDQAVDIGQELVGSGAIDAETWNAACTYDDPSRVLALTPGVDSARLRSVIAERIVELLFPLPLLPDTPYAFHDGERHPFGTGFAWDPVELVDAAERRMDDWRAVAEGIASLETVAVLDPYLPEGTTSVTIPAGEWALLARIDGRRSVGELVQASGLSAFAVCSALLRLREAGIVELLQPAEA